MPFTPPCSDNILLVADSYKVSHHKQYPPNTSRVFSYFESRGGVWSETVFFGLQYIIKQWLEGPVLTEEKIQEAKEVYGAHFGQDIFNEAGWRAVMKKYDGRLPIRIRAVREGSVVPVKNVLFTVENTDDEFAWLTNWFETLLVQTWYPTTVATNSREQKKIIAKYLDLTSDTGRASLPFKLHDFGFRGVSSVETASIGGLSHLVNFQGTDTIAGLIAARKFYGCKMAGVSIPAAEHSTITTWGRGGEAEGFRNMLQKFPTGYVAVVSDSYNIWEACSKLWGDKLKALIESRGDKGALVIRPDSGEPQEVVVKCLELLGKAFGCPKNKKGFRELPPYVRIIQGDGIDAQMIECIMQHLVKFGWSAECVAFGSGGALLQKLHRDTQKCAYKCSFATVDGADREVYKEPITDMGKKSKRGRLALKRTGDVWETVAAGSIPEEEDQLVTVFENGELKVTTTLEEVRALADVSPLSTPFTPMAECLARSAGAKCELCDDAKWAAWKAEWLS